MTKIFPPSKSFQQKARINEAIYHEEYASSIEDPVSYWREKAKRLHWDIFPKEIKDVSYQADKFNIEWYKDGFLNVSYNCIDRHLAKNGDKTAIIWEGDEPADSLHITYNELHDQVSRMANVLKARQINKGDRVIIYMPMIPEAAIAMLACARIGAIHSVVFGGFSPEALRDRIEDCQAIAVITADEGVRGGKNIPLKANVDEALAGSEVVNFVLVVKRTGGTIGWQAGRDIWWHDAKDDVSPDCTPEIMNAEDPLFILYTSGSTGKPKGVLHTTGGYLVYASYTHECIFDLRDDDIYWCTADVGWVTGHSYIVYGPLSNGATSILFEGIPTYPDASRFWQICEKHKVTTFYTAPTAIRSLMREGDAPVDKADLSSIRLLGTVGEPINPEAWLWYNKTVGKERCPIVDTWWQTETGGILISPMPGAVPTKPGCAIKPFFGVEPAIVDGDGNILTGEASGALVLLDSWPGQMRTVYGDQQRFIDTYFTAFPGRYFTGDGAKRDADGCYWITGRIDDVLNVSGHRMGTAEIESALVSHAAVAEAAVVGFPHDIKGQGIYCYVTLMEGTAPSETLNQALVTWVRKEIGAFAKPDIIQFTPGLPKTRSGKIMRRILRKIAEGTHDTLGDTSTLADPAVVDELIENCRV